MTPVCLPATEVRWVEVSGHRYRVSIAVPAGPAPRGGFPVLFLLDAGSFFGTVVETVRLRARRPDATRVTAALIVGVDCVGADDVSDSREQRERAYRWPGGAADLLQFMTGRLRELIATDYHVDWQRQILLGHSLGGFFVLYVLASQPAAFNAYVALSPSIWCNRPYLWQGVDTLSQQLRHPVKVFISVGEYEQKLAPWQSVAASVPVAATVPVPASGAVPAPTSVFARACASATAPGNVEQRRAARAMVDNARGLAQRLAGTSGVEVQFHDFPAEDHASAALAGIHHCLRFVLSPASGGAARS